MPTRACYYTIGAEFESSQLSAHYEKRQRASPVVATGPETGSDWRVAT